MLWACAQGTAWRVAALRALARVRCPVQAAPCPPRPCRYASALKALAKLAAGGEGKPAKKEAAALRAQLFGRLGWTHLRDLEERSLVTRFPAAYPRL
jgi:hypothetical protein